jgi:hypothetical protein
MQADSTKIEQYLPTIKLLEVNRELTGSDLFIPELQLYKEGSLEIYYVPFDYIKPNARILIAGITPGWTQMELAYRVFRHGLTQGKSLVEIYSDVEQAASFAGSMRVNLINMLDELWIPYYLGLSSSACLFSESHHLLHTTSVIRYPVFIKGENYTGHNPKLLKNSKLREFIDSIFIEELTQVPNALIIPQGKAVSEVLQYLIQQGKLSAKRCLLGFPHASGANGHRKKHFEESRILMEKQVEEWFQVCIS